MTDMRLSNTLTRHGLTGMVLMLAGLAAGCGGGSSSPTAVLNSLACDSTALWAALPALNGARIPDVSSQALTVEYSNQSCAVQHITTATLTLCLSHNSPSDLSWTLTTPKGVLHQLTPPPNWNATGTACAQDSNARLQTLDLTSILSNAQMEPRIGTWRLTVTDNLTGNSGTLLQWQIRLGGLG